MEKIIILGSINMDLVVSANRAPEGGETLFGQDFKTIPGGKGANQAVAIARQGVEVAMIARVGKDGFGDELVLKLEENNVQINQVKRDKSCSSGIAMIIVEESGQNRIIIVPGANGQIHTVDIDNAKELFESCDFLVMQLEVPIETVIYATDFAKSRGIKTVLNAAPAPTTYLGEKFLKQIDYLVVNETEAEAITGMPVKTLENAKSVVVFLQNKTKGSVILTLGDLGALAADGNSVWHTAAFKVNAVDTTASGDAFIGGLVASLHHFNPLKEAIIYANASGALAATKFGAQPSLPTKNEIQEFLLHNTLAK